MLYTLSFTGASACIQLQKFNEANTWCDKGLAVSFTGINILTLITIEFVCLFVSFFLEAPIVTQGVGLNTSVVYAFPKRISGWLVSENNTIHCQK